MGGEKKTGNRKKGGENDKRWYNVCLYHVNLSLSVCDYYNPSDKPIQILRYAIKLWTYQPAYLK